MQYPTLTPENKSRDFIDVFGGYNHNIRIQDNEFYDMENMSSSNYPLLSTRPKRGDVPSYIEDAENVYGMLYKSDFYYVTAQFYVSPSVSVMEPLTLHKVSDNEDIHVISFDGLNGRPPTLATIDKRKLIMMGAYMIVFPDKVYVNVKKPTEFGKLDAIASLPADPITNKRLIQVCTEDGRIIEIDSVGATAPESPSDGHIWLDTSAAPKLKKYYGASAMWASDIDNYIKLSGTNYAKDFSEGDGVKVSGITAETFAHLNGNTIIKKKPDDNTVIISAQFEDINANYRFFEVENSSYSSATSSVKLITDTPVGENEFVGASFIMGNQKVVCSRNTASTPKTGWHVTDDASYNLTNAHRELTTIDQYQSIGAYSAGTASRIFVQLDDNEIINTPPTSGRYICIGEDITDKYKIMEIDNQDGWVKVDNVYPLNVSAATKIYPLKNGEIAGKYVFTLFFTSHTKPIGNDTVVILKPDFIIQQNGAITIERTSPAMDYIIESNNRLWGCNYGLNNDGEFVNEIYASKLGDFKNWQCFEGVSTDSYAASCGTDGEWTGAINFNGHPIFFKESYIHTVYGSYPAQFQINSVTARGVQAGSSDSLAILNETLYYMSSEGVCAYDGSLPVNISNAFGDIRYHEAFGSAYNGKYYVYLKSDISNALMVYDAKRGLWHKEDDLTADRFCAVSDDIYYSDGLYIFSLFGTGGAESAPVQWFVETGEYGLSMIDSKYISRLNIRLALDKGANAMVSIQYNSSGVWEKLCNVVRRNISPFTLPIKPRRCDHFRLKIEGKGGVKIYSISKTISQGSDKTWI